MSLDDLLLGADDLPDWADVPADGQAAPDEDITIETTPTTG